MQCRKIEERLSNVQATRIIKQQKKDSHMCEPYTIQSQQNQDAISHMQYQKKIQQSLSHMHRITLNGKDACNAKKTNNP